MARQKGQIRIEIMQFFLENPERILTTGEIAGATGIDKSVVSRELKILTEQLQITKIKAVNTDLQIFRSHQSGRARIIRERSTRCCGYMMRNLKCWCSLGVACVYEGGACKGYCAAARHDEFCGYVAASMAVRASRLR